VLSTGKPGVLRSLIRFDAQGCLFDEPLAPLLDGLNELKVNYGIGIDEDGVPQHRPHSWCGVVGWAGARTSDHMRWRQTDKCAQIKLAQLDGVDSRRTDGRT